MDGALVYQHRTVFPMAQETTGALTQETVGDKVGVKTKVLMLVAIQALLLAKTGATVLEPLGDKVLEKTGASTKARVTVLHKQTPTLQVLLFQQENLGHKVRVLLLDKVGEVQREQIKALVWEQLVQSARVPPLQWDLVPVPTTANLIVGTTKKYKTLLRF